MTWVDSLESTARVVVATVLGYAALVTFLRIIGKRTPTKLNAFDLAK